MPFASTGLAPGDYRAPPLGAARGLGVEVQGHDLGVPALGAREHFLRDEGSLDSSFLTAQAPGAEGLTLGLRALEPGRLRGEEVVEAPPDPRLLRGMEGEAARGTTRGSPLRR